MNIGDHLVTPRTGYTHHGLYIGNGEVIHYAGFANGQSTGTICITSIKAFANGHDVSVKEHFFRCYDARESVERARGRLGEDWYNVLINNCEHFVNWCINGLHSSSQVNNAADTISTAHRLFKENAEREQQRQAIEAFQTVARRSVQREVERQIAPRVIETIVRTSGRGMIGTIANTLLRLF